MRKWSTIFLLAPATLVGAAISYSVEFEGLSDSKTLRTVRSASQLVALRKKPPSSINALRFRAESDIPELVRILHAHGYLEAEVDVRIEEASTGYAAIVTIKPGPLYRIESFRIKLENESPSESICSEDMTLENLGICIGDPADTKTILDSEFNAMHILSQCGYPLASMKNRDIIADGQTKRVKIFLTIDTGPLALFGPTTIAGNTSVKSRLIAEQIQWALGTSYDSCLVEGTQQALMDTGLFSSVYISHDALLEKDAQLPMKIDVSETKHRSVSLGASYQTTYGPGMTFGWENRNVAGMGRRFLLQLDIAQRGHSGIASYLIPNFHCMGQSYTFQAQAAHESINPYKMQSYNFLSRYDQEICNLFFSFGPKLEYLLVSSSVDNGEFFLVEVPIYLRYTNVKDFLNPLSGFRFDYRAEPAINIKDSSDFYYLQTFMFSSYIPIGKAEYLILAQKFTIGTIFSDGLSAIPVPKRFFGGSEDNLRGYKYYTVSPLEDDDKPIGGRSAIYYTLEPRFRISNSFGLVPFFDIGNVYLDQFPTFKGKWRKSVGMGLRYYSFIGPLRLDVAFPLNRREGIDPHWWVFVSLGQTF